jgi:hypothetical protein
MEQPTAEQLEDFIRERFVWGGLPVDRCSSLLFQQLARMPNRGFVNMPFQFVQQEIRYLEGSGETSTKPAKPFSKKGPLNGLMHKHFFVSTYEHLGINAKLAWNLDDPNSPKFHAMLNRVMKPYRSRTLSGADALQLSKKITNELMSGPGGIKTRLSGKATGDWIVYLTHEGRNYYLCIAKHEEEPFVLDAVRHCLPEFPFISDYVTF